MRIKDLGERKLIEVIRQAYSYKWPDSDSSYIDIGKRYLLITTDSISQKGHIPTGSKAEDVGYFFAAINLSDIAAMGGVPKYFMAAFTLPGNLDVKYLKGIERGIRRCLDKHGAKMIGGDLKEGRELVLTGIAMGEVEKPRMMRRTAMRKGDAVFVTGRLGRNAAAYYLWKNGRKDAARKLISVEPRIREGRFLSANGVKAAIDLSDGVYSVIHQLSRKGKLGFEINFGSLPVDPLARTAAKRLGISTEQLCLNFGGEYELLFSVPETKAAALERKARRSGISIARIGRITGNANTLVKEGRRTAITKRGYEHFS